MAAVHGFLREDIFQLEVHELGRLVLLVYWFGGGTLEQQKGYLGGAAGARIGGRSRVGRRLPNVTISETF